MGDSVSHEPSAAGPSPGGIRWEIEFYEDILKRNPDYVEVLSLLGGLYTGSKMYAKGLYVDQRLAMLKKDDPIVQYNLGCSYALVRQTDRAFEALNRAVDLGYRDTKHMADDHDLDGIRSDPRYAALVARIEQGTR
jgi:hypothetical protein